MTPSQRVLLGALIFSACSHETTPIEPAETTHHHVEEALFSNAGFESGNLTGWTLTTNLVATTPGVTAYPVTAESQLGLRAGGTAKTNVYTGAPYTLIPPGLTSAEAARYPRFGNYAAVVNELGSSYNANRITQSSVVTTADIDPADGLVHVRFTVLPVLQNPGHSLREQPYYYVTIINTTKGTTLASRFNFSNEAGVPWQTNAAGSVVYTDWLLFDLPLSRSAVSIGDTVTAVIIAGGCAQSGHWGEAIIDAFGSSIPGLVVYGSGRDSVEAGSDFQYTYRILNGGTTTTTGTKLTSYLPAGTTFRSVDTAGITCTTPTVGTRGTLVCNLGAVPANGSRTVKITVRADATATGAIRHGWYYSSSDIDQPLTGPLITTNVTTGGTTQYVDLVTSIDDAASSVMWGQSNTWSVTVRNAGTSTATGATITTNAPAQLNGLTWTCTPQAGASCGAATGSGALNTTATLPAGKSVTYTIDANVNAGAGTGLLSFTALATAPASTVEMFSLDNGAGDDDTIAGSVQTVTVNRAGTGTGTLSSTPSGVSCAAGCTTTTGSFASGTQVTIQAVPATGSVFGGWSGGTCSGTTPACTFTVAAGQTITGTFTANPILITSPATANAGVGRPFTYTLTALGTAPITLGATSLPAWLSFDAATGVLSGTPPAAGTFTVNLSATDVNGTDTQVLTITAGLPPTITSALTFTIVGTGTAWNTVTVTATGAATIQYNASNLPGTVYFNSTTGVFNGSSGALGVFNVPVIATNAFGSDYKVLAISVGGAPVITSALTSSATVGTAWTYTLTSTGTNPITLSVSSLPAWATFNATTGVISGTPTSAGTVSIGLTATNGIGASNQSLVLTIDGPAVITSGLTASGTEGQPFTYSLTAEGTTPITTAMTGLPAWLSFDAASGLLSGTPPAAGTYTVNMSATNALGTDAKSLTITIVAPPPTPTPPVITSPLTAAGVVGAAFSYPITASGQVPMTFSAAGLPAWASLDTATGIISGTPSAAGTFSITLGAVNALGSDSKTLTLSVVQPPVITSALTASGRVGQAFSYSLTATGSVPMTLSASSLPAWASFDAGTGIISGTPSADGTFNLSLGASNAGGSDSKTLVLTVSTAPSITSALTADAVVGDAFTYTVTATGTAPLTFTAGTLPAWASFNATTHVLSGTPTSAGAVNVSLAVSNAAGSDSQTLVITVRQRPAITSALTAAGIVGQAFSYTLTATGTAPITLSATSLPAWASFSASTGVISGTPTADGTFNVSLGASNSVGSTSGTLVLTVRTVPAITSALTATGVVGQAFSYTLTATGTAPRTLTATGLPAWASFNAGTGVISGTPTADGTFNVTLGASNAAGSDSQTLVVTVRTLPAITSTLTAAGVVGQAFSYTLTATGTAPITLSATSLPAWASFTAATGVISGTPTADGTFNVSLGASNAAGSDAKTLVLTVRTSPAITSALSATGVVGQAFSYTLTATGTAPVTLSATSLPAWASFNAGTGVISGTPTADGTFNLSLGASNAAGSDAKTLVLVVRTAPSITSALTAAGVVGQAFSYTLTATGTAPITLSATSLPAWASFNAATGVISGTPTADGTFNVALGASNLAGSAAQTLVLTVRTLPAITSALTAAGVVGQPFSYTVTASGTAPRTLTATSLPAWASFTPATGVISGTPTADGTFNVSLGVSNAAGSDAQTLVLTVRTTPAVTSALTAAGVVGQPFSYTVTASGTAPRTLTATSLPAWASFDAATGIISGTPTADGTFTLTLGASNAAGSDSKTLTLTVRTVPAITSTLTATGVVGQAFSYTLTASGTAPITLSATSLPAWASFNAATGVISGTPTADGTFNLSLGASSAAGSDAETLVLIVRTVPTITSVLAVAAVEGQPFSYTLTATGTAPITRTVTGLPAWASFDPATGIISGTPTAAGTFTVTLGATNAAGSDSRALVITCRTLPAITSALTATGVVGQAFSYTLTASGTAPITLSATSLPAWASFDAATGVISGTPTADATLNVTLGASNAAGADTKTLVITVRTRPAVTSALTTDAVVGQPFTWTLTASGTAPLTLSASSLPAWASFDAATGVISGTPDAAGILNVTVGATNAAGADSQTLVITVRTLPLITSNLDVAAVVGQPFSYAITGSGTPTLTFTVGALPAWLTFDGTGTLTGTPTADGTFTVALTVTNAAGSNTRTLTIVSRTRPAITNVLRVSGEVGRPLQFTLSASGTAPITFTGVTLPAGLTLVGTSISGTPTAAGTFQVAETATNAAGAATATLVFDVRTTIPAPVITGPAEGASLGSSQVTVRGTAPIGEAGNTVRVTENGAPVCEAVVQADGTWSCQATLAEGPHQVRAVIVDTRGFVGDAADTQAFTVDLTAPLAPAWTGPAAGAHLSNPQPELSGTGEPGATIQVTRGGQPVCTALVATDGTWRCTPSSALPEGPVTLDVTQTDVAGNTSPAASRELVIDTTRPTVPTIDAPIAGAIVSTPIPTLTGTAEANSTVRVYVDDVLLCTTTADAQGAWACVPPTPLADGPHRVRATSTDAAGNQSVEATSDFTVDTTTPAGPVIAGPTGRITDATPDVTGTAEPGATVTVTLDGQPLCTTTADAQGHWSCPVTTPLAEGNHAVTATATDAVGHVSDITTGTFEVQTASGTVTEPTTTTTSTDNGRTCGTATPGATVNVYVDGKLVGTTTAGRDGAWCFDLPRLTAGEHQVSIGVNNSSGEEVYRSGDQTVVIEKPVVDFGGGIGCSSTSQAPVGVLALLGLLFLSRRRRVARVAVVTTLLAVPALAQVATVSNFELEQLQLNPSARGGLVVGGADLLAPKDWRVAASLGYQYAPLKYFEAGKLKATLVDHRLTATLSGAAAVLPWLELGATLPVVLYQGGEPVTTRTGEMVVSQVPASVALGTPWLHGRMALFQERDGKPLDLGLTVMFGLPLGSGLSLTRESTVSGQVLVGAGRTFGDKVRVAAEVGAHLREEVVLVAGSEAVGSRLLGNVAASTVGGRLRAELSVRSFFPLTRQPVSAELLAGVRYAFNDWELFGIAGPGFGNAPGTPVFRAVLGASFGGITSAKCGGRAHLAADCPALDFDGDGVLNGDDACPTERASTPNGCVVVAAPAPAPEPIKEPEPAKPVDGDGDGVPDDVDACPAVAGTGSDGCAPPAPEPVVVAPPPQVELKAGRIELKGTVYFDTSKATLQPRSFPLLDEVATVMKAHPEVKQVTVEGHTDGRGDAAFNLKLSTDRAKAVKDYLVKAGIEPSRLESKGYGLTRPLAPNSTVEGREKNRRVEFIVIE